jgi:hypothetical protein
MPQQTPGLAQFFAIATPVPPALKLKTGDFAKD